MEWKTLCIKIGYSEPRGAESREWSSTLAGNFREFLGDVILVSVWLHTVFWFWARSECVRQCNRIGNGNWQCISMGHGVFVMYKEKEWAE